MTFNDAVRLAIEKPCRYCQTRIVRSKKWSSRQWERKKYCSNGCRAKGRDYSMCGGHNKGVKYSTPRKCDECSVIDGRVAHYSKWDKTLCQKHYWHFRLHGKSLWGDTRPYKTPEPKRLKSTLFGAAWRQLVLKRDDYRCLDCGERGKKLEAHHVFPFALFPRLRFDINNGQTLCVDCHKKTPTWGRKAHHLYDISRGSRPSDNAWIQAQRNRLPIAA